MNFNGKAVLAATIAVGGMVATAVDLDTLNLNGTAYEAVEDGTIGTLSVADGSTGNVLTVPAGVTLTVTSYVGGGELEKRGEGRFVICDVAPSARIRAGEGEVFFAKSKGVTGMASAATLHLDASEADSFTTVDDDGINVSKWYDVRDAKDAPAHPHAYFSWGAHPCRYAGKQNGQGIVDFFATTDGWTPCMLMMSSDDGAAESFSYGKGPGVTGVREVFMVVKDQPNANLAGRKHQSFLCDYDAPGNYNYWFCRGNGGEVWSSAYNETAGLRNGGTWVDGAAVSGTSAFPTGGFHLLRAKRTDNGRFSTLCYDHQGSSAAGLGGGLAIGELIVFRADGQPSDDVGAKMSSRLIHKWFGRQSVAALSVGANGHLETVSGETLEPSSLVLSRLEATVGTVMLQPKDVTFNETGIVVVTVPDEASLQPGDSVALLTASGTVTGGENLTRWTVSPVRDRRLKLRLEGNTLFADVMQVGMSIFIR